MIGNLPLPLIRLLLFKEKILKNNLRERIYFRAQKSSMQNANIIKCNRPNAKILN
jgi:hypothetical protein